MYNLFYSSENGCCVMEMLQAVGIGDSINALFNGEECTIMRVNECMWTGSLFENYLDTLQLAASILKKDVHGIKAPLAVRNAYINIGYTGFIKDTVWPIVNPWKTATESNPLGPISAKEFAIKVMMAYNDISDAEVIILKIYPSVVIENLFRAIEALEDSGAKKIKIEYADDYHDSYTVVSK